MTASRSSSVSPDMDDDDSIMDFEEELQQELENEMSASIDNLFGDELDDASDLFGDSRSATGTSAVGDRAVTEFSDDDDEDEDDEDDEDDPVLESDDDDDDDNGVDADLFGDGSAADSDDDDDFDIDFEDPPVNPNAVSSHPSANDTNTLIDDDSASDDEFEAVEFDFEAIQTGLEGPSFNTAAHTVPNRESSASILQRKRARTRVHIGDTYMLERYKDEQPSLTLHLFDSHFRFEGQEGVFLYNGPMRFFFQALNEGKIPIDLVDVLMQVNCRYYEGCLIVEVRDHRRPTLEPKTKKQRVTELLTSSLFGGVPNFNSLRPAAQTHSPTSLPAHVVPEPGSIATQNCQPTIVSGTTADCPQDADGAKVYKKVMRPTSETVNLDIQLACERSRTKLSQNDVLEMEGMILLAVEEPLDLEPDFQVSRVSNAIRYIEYEHLLPRKRRKFNSAEIEAEKAEREEKLKLLTLMDDRKTREFQPSFNRVSQVNDWRHKKYVNDAEVYPAAVPVAPTGKKASNKKNRSQVSLLADGRKVIRTLRFVQTINGRSTHTVFHVAELPDGKGLQGIMRWGTLPDTSINGGSKMFSFPNEDIMRMHIDNFKLLLSIENNRLIYDSVYPNGIPTADPPPDSTASPSIPQNHPSTSTNMSVAVPDSTAVSPTIESEAPSPVVTTTNTLASTLPVSPVVAKAELPKAKESVAKNSARGSRKNSPQPKGRKVGNRASASASVEPEVETVKAKPAAGVQRATKETGQKGKATAKKSSAVSDRGSPAPELPIQNKVPEPVADAMPIPEPVLIKEALPAPAKPVSARSKSATKLKTAAAAAAALVPEPEPEPEPVPAPAPAQTEERPADPVTVAETNALAAKEKKGAKGTRKTPAPKEKKPRAKPKTAAAKGASNPAAALQPDAEAVQSPTASQPLIPTSAGAAVGINNLTRVNTNAAAEDEATLSQKPEMSGSAPMANGAGAYLLLSPSMLHATGTPLPVSASAAAAVGPPTMQSPPGLQSPAPGGLPMQMAQIAMAQLNARLTSMAQANGGLRMELPEFLTKEYLHANPQYTTMLRNEIARMAVQQRMQQQGIQNAGNLGPMGSPHVRTGISPNMAAAAAQMVQATQNNAGVATGAGASPAPVANLGTPVQAPNANPMLTSPN
ncbi:Transcription factor spt20, partial [Kickxella alabastrina]